MGVFVASGITLRRPRYHQRFTESGPIRFDSLVMAISRLATSVVGITTASAIAI
ncbi:hypothetical protein OK016_13770 [Vibrio chagasii]|nr:hypothetical protein [Vibrio chagasii]